MNFTAAVDTDIGNGRKTNQDSALIKHAVYKGKELLLAIVCDGIGGLKKGELASATVIRRFEEWFEQEGKTEFYGGNMKRAGERWQQILLELNEKIAAYGRQNGLSMGTTFTGLLFSGNQYLISHVGDTRAYFLDTRLKQLTEDQTVAARRVRMGELTLEQAERDSQRNVLLQCIGASQSVVPQMLYGTVKKGIYLICSDGFRHQITKQELKEYLSPGNLMDKESMQLMTRYLIELAKARQEQDNITALLVKVE